MLLTVTRCHCRTPVFHLSQWGSGGYPQPPEANVKWFSVASPGPAGNFLSLILPDVNDLTRLAPNVSGRLGAEGGGQCGFRAGGTEHTHRTHEHARARKPQRAHKQRERMRRRRGVHAQTHANARSTRKRTRTTRTPSFVLICDVCVCVCVCVCV